MKIVSKAYAQPGQITLKDTRLKSGKPYVVSVVPEKQVRSLDQNAYYWGVVIKMAGEHLGYYDDEMHDAFRHQFLVDRSKTPALVRSTATLDTGQFTEYLEKCRQLMAEQGCVIPDPATSGLSLLRETA